MKRLPRSVENLRGLRAARWIRESTWFRAVPSGPGGWWDEDWSGLPLPPTEAST